MAADEFQTVWNACCAGTEEIIVGVKTFGELVPKNKKDDEGCLAQLLPSSLSINGRGEKDL